MFTYVHAIQFPTTRVTLLGWWTCFAYCLLAGLPAPVSWNVASVAQPPSQNSQCDATASLAENKNGCFMEAY